MQRLRVFIAIEVSSDVRARAQKIVQALSPATNDVKWVEPQNLHVTLNFLGDVELLDLPKLCKVMQEAVADVPPFDVQFAGAGAFPSIDRPRTIWLGVKEGAEELRNLQQHLQSALGELGYRGESRLFQPHLTLGRVKGQDPVAARELALMLDELGDYPGGATDVTDVVLFSSTMERRGPTYEALGDAPLAGK